ncbi:hypothetical protein NBRC116494_02080 [Aurantivibrio plasticivorans]
MALPDHVHRWLKKNQDNDMALDELSASLIKIKAAAGTAEKSVIEWVGSILRTCDLMTVRAASIAETLCVSERTLSRKLSKKGTSFKRLLDAERRRRYLFLKTDSKVTISEIAEALGFSDNKSLYRALKRWGSSVITE